jgi:hypothetical protein
MIESDAGQALPSNASNGTVEDWEDTGAGRHGVLFVHGLGQQPQSDTLLWFGRPLVDWLMRWHQARGEPAPVVESVTLGFWPFDPGEFFFQPRARLRLPRPDGQPDTWVLAEAWWAASSQRPDFWSMIAWTWRYLKVAIAGLLHAARVRWRRLLHPKPNSTDPQGRWGWVRFVDLANTFVAAILYLLAGITGYLVLIPLMVLARLPLPGLQDFILVRLLQPLLQMQIGEFRTYLEDELQAANMRRRVAESIRWLLEPQGGGCADVTIVAHSGGALLAFGALTDEELRRPGAPLGDGRLRQVRKLITVGQGLNKAWRFYPALKRMHGPLPGHMHWLDIWTAYDPVPAGALTPPADDAGEWRQVFVPDETVRETQRLKPRADPDPHDVPRTADRGPSGVMAVAAQPYWPVSQEVTNRMLVLIDHGLYWTNDEQVLVRLAAEIDAPYHAASRFWRGNGTLLSNEEQRTQELRDAVQARRIRVAWLAACRALFIVVGLAIAVACWVSGLTRPQGDLGGFLTRFLLETGLFQPVTVPLAALFDWLQTWLQAAAPPLLRPLDVLRSLPVVLLGSLVVNLPLIVIYLALGKIWDTADAEARVRAVEQIARAGLPPRPGPPLKREAAVAGRSDDPSAVSRRSTPGR